MSYENLFKMRQPCKDCPFLKEGAIDLRPGRLENIISALESDDNNTFLCHKTVHNALTGGEWDDDGKYHHSGLESYCVGALIYLEKSRRPNVAMRLGRALGMYDPKNLEDSFDKVIEPKV